jgi:hypothetical protein
MKQHFRVLFALSALVFAAGCKKQATSSVELSSKAKATITAVNPNWKLSTSTSRLVAFDCTNTGNNCILNYDIGTDQLSVTQIIGNTSTNLWTSPVGTGITFDNHEVFHINTWAATDNYNEVGGVHMIALDYNKTGHMDHILVYVPGQSIAILMTNGAFGLWRRVTPGLLGATGGIGGYDLRSTLDKIIAYDLGSGFRNVLLAYRPGSGTFWAIQNQPTPTAPYNWVGVVKSSGGVGGFDLHGTTDQLVAEDFNPGSMNLIAFRPGPGLGYVWHMSHAANSVSWVPGFTSHSGLFNFSGQQTGDRVVAVNMSGSTVVNANNEELWYRPGTNSAAVLDAISGVVVGGGPVPASFYSYPMNANPYPSSFIGDHVLPFNGAGFGNSSLLCYQNGTNLSYIFYLNTTTGAYTQMYP